MKPLAPEIILQGRYKIAGLIGKGGMGEVYLASDTRLGHSIALKRTTVGDDPLLNEAFEQEAKTLASLRHNVLPKVSDHFTENGEQFLVMEYIEGDDLSKRLRTQETPFPLNWVMFWADQLLAALDYLHKHDPPIVHRDIKPQNLKLTPDNQIILLDFGLSKRSMDETKITSSGSVVGYTPHYAPMEQIRGTGTNAASDLYSLSATLYQLITKQIPADALKRADAVISGTPDPLIPAHLVNPEISERIANVIARGMEIGREKRFQSAREMQKEMRLAFNEFQETVSAETIAFSVDEVEHPADEKTEIYSASQLRMVDAAMNSDIRGSELAEEHSSLPLVNLTTEVPISNIPPLDFSGEKTEVFYSPSIDVGKENGVENGAEIDFSNDVSHISAESEDFFAEDSSAFENSYMSPPAATEYFSSPESQQVEVDPHATIMNYSEVESSPSPTNYSSQYLGEEDAEVAVDSEIYDTDPSKHSGEHESREAEKPTPIPQQKKKDSGGEKSKYGLILGGVALFLVLGISAVAAIGYYMTRPSNSKTVVPENANVRVAPSQPIIEQTPEMTPEATPEEAPAIEATPETTGSTTDAPPIESNPAPPNTQSIGQSGKQTSAQTGAAVKAPAKAQSQPPQVKRTPSPVKPQKPPVSMPPKKSPPKDPGILQ